MERTLIAETIKKVGQKVRICGWVQIVRDQGAIKFLILRDRTGIIQAVSIKNTAVAKIINSLSLESVVEIIGTAKEEKQAPGGIEVTIEKIKILSSAAPGLPIPVVEKGADFQSLDRNGTSFQRILDY
ncbi:MAG: OB-fold nucleic acid binding domain-containing protein [Candidatus Shapirobacteria bacterium]|nr:OB-fold nucleic acid binding domain-containing protein [Candidatus Shapirobacteria bacterium]